MQKISALLLAATAVLALDAVPEVVPMSCTDLSLEACGTKCIQPGSKCDVPAAAAATEKAPVVVATAAPMLLKADSAAAPPSEEKEATDANAAGAQPEGAAKDVGDVNVLSAAANETKPEDANKPEVLALDSAGDEDAEAAEEEEDEEDAGVDAAATNATETDAASTLSTLAASPTPAAKDPKGGKPKYEQVGGAMGTAASMVSAVGAFAFALFMI